jgi:thiosulfate dehydrogenase [quinone] large subunit
MKGKHEGFWLVLRLALSFIFLWTFFDKTFGLGFNTPPDKAWLGGTSPTFEYLTSETYGPFSAIMQSIAGHPVVDGLFMLGLLFVGLSLLTGVGLQFSGYAGALLMLLIWASRLPPENNPIVDEHIIYAIVLTGMAILQPSWQFNLERLRPKPQPIRRLSKIQR